MLAAVVSNAVIPAFGWRPLFVSGGILGLVIMLFVGVFMTRVEKNDKTQSADALSNTAARHSWKEILRGASLSILILGTLATLADLLTWYGVSVWLTQLMREFDVPFSNAMQLMFTLNIGAIIGSLFTGSLAIRWGARPIAIAAGLLAALCLVLIASRMLTGWTLFTAIALLGMSAISAQNLLNSMVADAFPARHRAAAMGITLGLGRVGAVIAPTLGGYILASAYGPSGVLNAFAIFAVLGSVLLLAFTRQRSQASLRSLA